MAAAAAGVRNNSRRSSRRSSLSSGGVLSPQPVLRSGSSFLTPRAEGDAPKLRRLDHFGNTFCGKIVKSKAFDVIASGVIVLNALFIGWDIDYQARFGKPSMLYDTDGGKPVLIAFVAFENMFAAYFTAEILIRFAAYRRKRNCLRDGWFLFDSSLVGLMVVETWILPFVGGGGAMGSVGVIRLLRLLRITRMVKLMRAFPQLMMIVKSIGAAARAVIWTFLLLIMITYTWAILFTNEFHQGKLTNEYISELDDGDPDRIADYFGSMGKSMLSLLVMGTILDDVTDCADTIRSTRSTLMLLAFIIYILLNSFTMMNMLVGILVEVVGSTAEGEREMMREKTFQESFMQIFNNMDEDGSGRISREEFLKMREHHKVMAGLKDLGINDQHFHQYVELLFNTDLAPFVEESLSAKSANGPSESTSTGAPRSTVRVQGDSISLSCKELLECICRLRPGTGVSALDFAAFRESIFQSQGMFREKLSHIEKLCTALSIDHCLPPKVASPPLPDHSKVVPPASPPPEWTQPPAMSMFTTPIEEQVGCIERSGSEVEWAAQLQHISSAEILQELERRLGMKSLREVQTVVTKSETSADIPTKPARVPAAAAFAMLGVPENEREEEEEEEEDVGWSKETLIC